MIPDPDDITVKMLVPSDKRRLTVEEHGHWREILAGQTTAPGDAIDELIADIRNAREEEAE